MDREARTQKMKQLDNYYWELAEYAVQKYKPTKLDVLKKASVDRSCCLGIACPYPILDSQIAKCLTLGAHPETLGWKVMERIIALTFPEFNKNMDFLMHFSCNYKFWELNLEYYKKKQRTIFEDYKLPVFDWEAWDAWIIKRIKNFENNIVDEEVNREEERQGLLLREYGELVMEMAKNAVANL